METTPAASLDIGKEQGNLTVDARSEGQFGCSPLEPVRHRLRDEAKEVLPDARPQAWENRTNYYFWRMVG